MTRPAPSEDRRFRDEFEALVFPKTEFRHRQHLRLAYVYLCEGGADSAHERMRAALLAFIGHRAIDPAKLNTAPEPAVPSVGDPCDTVGLPYASTAGRPPKCIQERPQQAEEASKRFNETLTKAWILAVRHFMEKAPGASCFADLVAAHPVMLDPRIMHTHYTVERLHSPRARVEFVEPDLDPIPRYGR